MFNGVKMEHYQFIILIRTINRVELNGKLQSTLTLQYRYKYQNFERFSANMMSNDCHFSKDDRKQLLILVIVS